MTKIQPTKEKLKKSKSHNIEKAMTLQLWFFFDFTFLLENFFGIIIDTKVKYLLIKNLQWLFVSQTIVYCASATKLKNTDCPRMADKDSNAILVTIHSQYDELDEHMTIVSKKE